MGRSPMRERNRRAVRALLVAWAALILTLNAHEVEQLDDSQDLAGAAKPKMNTAQFFEHVKAQQMASDEDLADVADAAEGNSDKDVPDTVKCYWKLVGDAQLAKATVEEVTKAKEDSVSKLKTAKAANVTTVTTVGELKREQGDQLLGLKELRASHKVAHGKALTLYARAKGSRDKYGIERKKVDLDVKHYKKLSSRYMKSYKGLQARLKKSYTEAAQYQKEYTVLSAQYQAMSKKANKIAGEIDKLGDTVGQTKMKYQTETSKLKGIVHDISVNDKKAKSSTMSLKAAVEHQKALANRLKESKTNSLKLTAMAFRLVELGGEVQGKAERNEVRYLNFVRDTEKAAADIETTAKKVMLQKKKYQAANAIAIIYSKSYKAGSCEALMGQQEGVLKLKASLSAEELLQLSTNSGEGSLTTEEHGASNPDIDEAKKKKQCSDDLKVATANLKAARKAKEQHVEELRYLAQLQQAHAEAEKGAKTTKAAHAALTKKAA